MKAIAHVLSILGLLLAFAGAGMLAFRAYASRQASERNVEFEGKAADTMSELLYGGITCLALGILLIAIVGTIRTR